MLDIPRYPRGVITHPIDDVAVKDVGKEIIAVWTVIVVGVVMCLLQIRMFSQNLLEMLNVGCLLNI